MSDTLSPVAPRHPRRRRRHARRSPRPLPQALGAVGAVIGVGLGITIGLAVTAESWGALHAPGGWLTAGGRLAGLVGGYLMLVVVLLAARVPIIERAAGQHRLMGWHRRLAPWSLIVIALHGALITAGYAASARTGLLHQYWELLRTYAGVLAATVAFALLLAAGVTSAQIARRRMRYETWWAVHLYTYLALALAFSHQIDTGASFVGHPAARTWWTVLWVGTGGVALTYRVLLPVWRTLMHRLIVVSVRPVAPGVVSVVCRGRWVERMPVSGGQFFQWRILKRGLWWQAHPYSLSAMPSPPFVRFTVKNLGDHSGVLAELTPGTRLAIEGPYGAFTADARRGNRVALIGAGVGVTPLLALLEDLPLRVDAVTIIRARATGDLIHREELHALARRRGENLHELTGPREQQRLDARVLARLIPDLAQRDVYVCGPTGFTDVIDLVVTRLGVPPHRIHHENFGFEQE